MNVQHNIGTDIIQVFKNVRMKYIKCLHILIALERALFLSSLK